MESRHRTDNLGAAHSGLVEATTASLQQVCANLYHRARNLLPQSWRLSGGSARSGEDQIKLVGDKINVHRNSAAISGGSGAGSTFLLQTGQEEASNGVFRFAGVFLFVSADT
jgi:hypothetical protein